MLFEKCMRGDTSDNVLYSVRTKGTKNKVGLLEAFEDSRQKVLIGTIMLQRWTNFEGVEHSVR